MSDSGGVNPPVRCDHGYKCEQTPQHDAMSGRTWLIERATACPICKGKVISIWCHPSAADAEVVEKRRLAREAQNFKGWT